MAREYRPAGSDDPRKCSGCGATDAPTTIEYPDSGSPSFVRARPLPRLLAKHRHRDEVHTLRSSLFLALIVAYADEAVPTASQPPPAEPETPARSPRPTTRTAVVEARAEGRRSKQPWTPPSRDRRRALPVHGVQVRLCDPAGKPGKPTATFHEARAGAAPDAEEPPPHDRGQRLVVRRRQWSTDDATKETEVRFGDSADKLDKIAHGFSFTAADRGSTSCTSAVSRPARRSTTTPGRAKRSKRPQGHDRARRRDRGDDPRRRRHADDPAKLGGFAEAPSPRARRRWSCRAMPSPTATTSRSGTRSSGCADLFAELPGHLGARQSRRARRALLPAVRAARPRGRDHAVEEWFATTYGPLRFVVLNDTVSTRPSIAGSEKQFLEATLKASIARARRSSSRCTTSRCTRSSIRPRAGRSCAATWAPLYDQYKVNAVLNGHVHSYESTKPLKGGTVDGGAGSDAARASSSSEASGAPLYCFNPIANEDWLQKKERTHGFAILKASGTAPMTWTAYREDGSTIETITMPKHVSSTRRVLPALSRSRERC